MGEFKNKGGEGCGNIAISSLSFLDLGGKNLGRIASPQKKKGKVFLFFKKQKKSSRGSQEQEIHRKRGGFNTNNRSQEN